MIVFLGCVLIIQASAFPPPPPDMFSKDADSRRPDLTKASPVPLAHPSHPPPAPPGTTKCNLSIAKAEVEIALIIKIEDIILISKFLIFPPKIIYNMYWN
jgi:hypothetical protein